MIPPSLLCTLWAKFLGNNIAENKVHGNGGSRLNSCSVVICTNNGFSSIFWLFWSSCPEMNHLGAAFLVFWILIFYLLAFLTRCKRKKKYASQGVYTVKKHQPNLFLNSMLSTFANMMLSIVFFNIQVKDLYNATIINLIKKDSNIPFSLCFQTFLGPL